MRARFSVLPSESGLALYDVPSVEAMSNESRVKVDKSEEVAQGWQHALSYMVSTDDLEPSP